MPLEVYHLGLSQSERIVWLLEEMKLPYDLKLYTRDPHSGLAPASLKEVTPAGTAPYFRDTSVTPPISLSESGAIVEYILSVYGKDATGTRMNRAPGDSDYATYLNWLHYSNATLQASIGRSMTLAFAGASDSEFGKRYSAKLAGQLQLIDGHLSNNKWLAGNEISAADAMTVFTLTTMRGFFPVDLGAYKNILRYLKDAAERPAYREALRKGDGGMEPMVQAKTRKFTQFEAFRGALEKNPNGV